jgi:hypothetical protein
MSILNKIKTKFNRVYGLITSKILSNKSDKKTNQNSSSLNKELQTKINKFGFPIIVNKIKDNKRR